MTTRDDVDLVDGLTIHQREKLARVLDEYLVALERGEPVAIDELMSQHPDLATPLRLYGESLRMLCLAGGQLGARRPTGGSDTAGSRELGDFRLVREIGRGGMGVVYEAEQISLHRRVALKILPFAAVMDQKQLARFANEARAAAQLNHTNIVPVYGVGSDRGVHYYSMQLIAGRPLDRLIAELAERNAAHGRGGDAAGTVAEPDAGRLPASDSRFGRSTLRDRDFYRAVANLGIQAAGALHHAHELGVIHRDIKPSNLLLDDSGKLWITDFGLARLPADSSLTLSGAVLGTARYMSPEQAAGEAHLVDHRADIYSLGITLYELITLRPAFEAVGPRQFPQLIHREEPAPPRRLNPAIPADLETIVLKAIGREREARYQTAAALADDLQRYLDGRPTLARRPTLRDRAVKWSRRHAAIVAAAAVFLFAACVMTSVAAWAVSGQKHQTSLALRSAQRQLERAEANYRQARQVVDRYGVRLSEDLAEIPGLEAVRRELLEDSWHCYEALLHQSQDEPALRAEQALTRFKAAEIAAQLGDSRRAIDQYSAARDVFAELLREDPASIQHRSRLSLCHNNLGLILAGVGDAHGAEAAYRRAEELAAEACRAEPGISAHRWRLALVQVNLGLLHGQRGRIDEAAGRYGRAIALLEAVVAQEPEREEYRKDLAVAYNNRGVLHRTANPAKAAADNGRALESFGLLARQRPNRIDYRSEWATCQSNQGVLLAEIGPAAPAAAALRQAIASQEQLVREVPARPAYRRDLAVSFNNLGHVLLDDGALDEADRALEQAQHILDALTNDHPNAVEHWSMAGGILNNRATLHERRGDAVGAAAAFQQAIQRLRRACEVSRDAIEPRMFLAQALDNYARLLGASDRHDEAARIRRERIALEVPDGVNSGPSIPTDRQPPPGAQPAPHEAETRAGTRT